MRLLPFILLLATLGCGPESLLDAPELERLYFPTGLAHDAVADDAGTLYVASSDFDKRYDFGAVTAIHLPSLGLEMPAYLRPQPPGTPLAAFPVEPSEFPELGISEEQRVLIAPFAGQMAAWRTPQGRLRLFVPSRAEGDKLFAVEADGAALSCVGDPTTRDCTGSAPSLTRDAEEAGEEGADGFAAGKPRAPAPYAVAVDSSGRVRVTHLALADSPLHSRRNPEAYLVTATAGADPFTVTADSFFSIGGDASSGIAIGERYVYLSGRATSGSVPSALRLVDMRLPGRPALGVLLENDFRVQDTRDVVLSADERRLFLVSRFPDRLLVIEIGNPEADFPTLNVVDSVPLPAEPNVARLIPRAAGRGSLVAISCTGANEVALYDDSARLATVVSHGMGLQPFGLAVHGPPGATGARVFVSNFGDGQISVIDIRDVNLPADARVVARLGPSQLCLTDPLADPCPGNAQ